MFKNPTLNVTNNIVYRDKACGLRDGKESEQTKKNRIQINENYDSYLIGAETCV